jgi:hypothetical protein
MKSSIGLSTGAAPTLGEMFDEIMRFGGAAAAPPVLIVSLATGQVLWPAAKLAEAYIVPMLGRLFQVAPRATSGWKGPN